MEMKLEGNKFWVLRDGENDELRLYDEFEDSVKQVKDLMDQDRESESIELMEAKLEGDKAKFKAVGWGQIAEHLVKID